MISRSKPHCLALVVTCCIGLLSAGAFAQDTDTIQQQPDVQAPSIKASMHDPTVYLDSFEGFIQLIGREDERNANLVKAGRPTLSKIDLTRVAGITDSEQQAIRVICTNGDKRIREHDSQEVAASWKANEIYNADTVAKRDALMQQRPQLIEAIVSQMQQALGEKDFKKLTAYVYSLSPKTAIKTISSPGVTRLPPPQNDPNPEPSSYGPASMTRARQARVALIDDWFIS